MPQTFEPAAELVVKLVVVAIIGLGAVVVVIALGDRDARDPVGVYASQPVPFSHKHHVGEVGLDCRFCHALAETGATPGMPSASLCLGCHSQLLADQAVFRPLHESVASGRPIRWTRLNRLPDYVYFDHHVHVANGVACMSCHGRVDQMALMQRPQRMPMTWCVECHERPQGRIGRPNDVYRMPAPSPDPADPAVRMQLARLEPLQRRVDCSSCHR
jgi:hypothetical protein